MVAQNRTVAGETVKSLSLGISRAVRPLLGDAHFGPPWVFDWSSAAPEADSVDWSDTAASQRHIDAELRRVGRSWGIGRYGEERKTFLRFCPQMIEQGRTFHVGLDVVVPAGTSLLAPLTGYVIEGGVEEGRGNYGGFVIVDHQWEGLQIKALYGHLDADDHVPAGTWVEAGERFASIGGPRHSGGWFAHLHLQLLSEQAVQQQRTMQGYVTPEDLPGLDALFPDPSFLVRAATSDLARSFERVGVAGWGRPQTARAADEPKYARVGF